MYINQSLEINHKILRNRIVMPPMATGKAVQGMPSEAQINYYKGRAKATAMIIVEHEYVSAEGMASKGQLSIADDSVIEGYRKLTKAVHEEGALILAQISHAGGVARDIEDVPVAPSPIVIRPNMPEPREMTVKDINRVIQDIPAAARIFEQAGIDFLDISGGHCIYTIKGKTEPGWFAELSKSAKQAVKIPVMLTGGVNTGEDAEKLLEGQAADLIGVGRSMMRDAEWTQKALAEVQ